jgi:hypothetical protein
VARSATSWTAGNVASLKHGLRSTKVLQETRNRLRSQSRAALLTLKPTMAEPELTIGERILADIEQVSAYVDRQGGPISTRGQARACMNSLDRLLGQWDRFCRRNGVGYTAASGSAGNGSRPGLAALLADES